MRDSEKPSETSHAQRHNAIFFMKHVVMANESLERHIAITLGVVGGLNNASSWLSSSD